MLAGVSMSLIRTLSEQFGQLKLCSSMWQVPCPFCESHLACGCTIGFHDVGMHTSASAIHSTLPASDLPYNDIRKARLQSKCAGHCRHFYFPILSPLPTPLPYFIMRFKTMVHSLCLTGSFLELQEIELLDLNAFFRSWEEGISCFVLSKSGLLHINNCVSD